MSEKNPIICKRNLGEKVFEESTIKRMRLDDDDDLADSQVFRSLSRTVSSSSLAYSASDSRGFSAALPGENDHRSSGISSGCSSGETNEIATNTRLPFLDLEVKISNFSVTQTINAMKLKDLIAFLLFFF